VLAKLLKEGVSIRNLPVIFETLADFGKVTSDTDILAEYVRQALARQITNQHVGQGEMLKVATLSGKIEKTIADAIQQTEHGNYLSLDPSISQKILESIASQVEQFSILEQAPIVLCSLAVRMYVRQLTERYFPKVPILSYNELEANVEVQSVGVVNLD
jgi:flagellar biosynthesis protein FlhA